MKKKTQQNSPKKPKNDRTNQVLLIDQCVSELKKNGKLEPLSRTVFDFCKSKYPENISLYGSIMGRFNREKTKKPEKEEKEKEKKEAETPPSPGETSKKKEI